MRRLISVARHLPLAAILLLLVLMSAVGSVVASPGPVFVDTFDDNIIHTDFWGVFNPDGLSTVEAKNQRLEVTNPPKLAESSRAGLTSGCKISGDFDIRVRYELLQWPSGNDISASLKISHGTSAWSVDRSRNREVKGGVASTFEVYSAQFVAEGKFATVQTTDTSGTLRLERVGTTVTAYFLGPEGFVPILSYDTGVIEDVPGFAIVVGGTGKLTDTVKTAFDDFTIEKAGSGGKCKGRTVRIDIKPGSFPNSINPKSQGTIPVAILSTPDFDAPGQVDKTSLTFGRTGDEHSLAVCTKSAEDVNSDGLLDQVCHFNTQDTAFQKGDTEGILRGMTVDGRPMEGRDSVRIVN